MSREACPEQAKLLHEYNLASRNYLEAIADVRKHGGGASAERVQEMVTRVLQAEEVWAQAYQKFRQHVLSHKCRRMPLRFEDENGPKKKAI